MTLQTSVLSTDLSFHQTLACATRHGSHGPASGIGQGGICNQYISAVCILFPPAASNTGILPSE